MKFRFWRCAEKGQFVTKDYAEEHPDTTVGETVEITGYKREKDSHKPLVLWYPLGEPKRQ